jgi:hypothetical protein
VAGLFRVCLVFGEPSQFVQHLLSLMETPDLRKFFLPVGKYLCGLPSNMVTARVLSTSSYKQEGGPTVRSTRKLGRQPGGVQTIFMPINTNKSLHRIRSRGWQVCSYLVRTGSGPNPGPRRPGRLQMSAMTVPLVNVCPCGGSRFFDKS